jgi:hypothetical protein
MKKLVCTLFIILNFSQALLADDDTPAAKLAKYQDNLAKVLHYIDTDNVFDNITLNLLLDDCSDTALEIAKALKSKYHRSNRIIDIIDANYAAIKAYTDYYTLDADWHDGLKLEFEGVDLSQFSNESPEIATKDIIIYPILIKILIADFVKTNDPQVRDQINENISEALEISKRVGE